MPPDVKPAARAGAAGDGTKARDDIAKPTTVPTSIHPLALLGPEMLRDEYVELVGDVKRHGLREPIVLYQDMILDGRHRYRACLELSIEPTTRVFTGTEAEARAYVLSANVHRRHLSFEQKTKLVAAELKRDPAQSDRSIAKKAKVDHKTVAATRKAAETTGEIPQLKKRVGIDGKARGAKSSAATASTPKPAATPIPDANIPLTPALIRRLMLTKEVQAEINRRAFQIADDKIDVAVRRAVARERKNKSAQLITQEEFRLLRSCLHSDRQTEAERKKYDRAFQIFSRFDPHISESARERKAGWTSEGVTPRTEAV